MDRKDKMLAAVAIESILTLAAKKKPDFTLATALVDFVANPSAANFSWLYAKMRAHQDAAQGDVPANEAVYVAECNRP